MSTVRSRPCCTWSWLIYLWVSRAPPDTGMSLPNMTTAQLLLHMSRNGTSGVQGSLRLECEPLRSSDVARIRWCLNSISELKLWGSQFMCSYLEGRWGDSGFVVCFCVGAFSMLPRITRSSVLILRDNSKRFALFWSCPHGSYCMEHLLFHWLCKRKAQPIH